MKRGMEAQMVLYQALNKICLKDFSKTFPEILNGIKSPLKNFCKSFNILDTTKTYVPEIEAVLRNYMKKSFFKLIRIPNEVTGQAKFYLNFIKMYELLLLFTRVTRQSLWDLHLASLEAIIPYFLVHDLQNYARLIRVYIAQMWNIKIYEEGTWKFFENGNFSVNKIHFPFSAIGADHGIEQLNRELKVIGIPCARILAKRNNWKKESRDKHYQITSTTSSRFMDNVDKLLSHFKSIETSFESSEHMYNIASNAVLSESVASDITNQQSTRKKMYESFKSERIYGEKSISDAMKKCKLQTFKS